MGSIGGLYRDHREGISYVFWGALTTVVNLLAYMAFVRWCGIGDFLSNILSWVVGVVFAFAVNKWFVFRSRGLGLRTIVWELGSFTGSRIFTGVIAWVLFPIINATAIGTWSLDFWILGAILGTSGMGAKIITSLIEIVLNWVLSKHLVFKKGQSESERRPRVSPRDARCACPTCRSRPAFLPGCSSPV